MTTMHAPVSSGTSARGGKRQSPAGIRGLLWWLSRLAMTFGLLIILLAAWQLAAMLNPNPHIPSPAQIGDYALKLFVTGGVYMSPQTAWIGQALPTLGRALLGFALGSVWGIALGTAIGLSRVFRYSTSWVVEFLRALPASAVLPLFILVLGGTDWMRVAFIAYGLSLYLLINAAGGVGSVDQTLIMMGRSFRLSRGAIIWRIVLPAALPQIYAGLRIATNSSIILAILSELFVASNGIGYQIRLTGSNFNYQGMWAWILLLSLFGLLFNLTVGAVERRLLGWHRSSH
jgi:ABC-type nitrate/sulfonate/bicarbonate transport system permease component